MLQYNYMIFIIGNIGNENIKNNFWNLKRERFLKQNLRIRI